MPELPEVETVRAGIADHSLGRPVRAVRVVDARSIRRHLPGPTHFEAALTGRALRGAYRRGKYLWLTLSEADGTLADEALVVSCSCAMSRSVNRAVNRVMIRRLARPLMSSRGTCAWRSN